MRRLIQWFRELLNRVWRKIKLSRFFLGLIMLSIGVSYTVCFYEGMELKTQYDQSMQIWEEHLVHKANAQRSGEEVSDTSVSSETSAQVAENVKGQTSASSIKELSDKIHKIFPECPDVAVAIAKAESNLVSKYHTNSNGSVDCGIFQINSVHNPTKEQCENEEENIKLAKNIYDKSGWNAWYAFQNNSYKKYLTTEK